MACFFGATEIAVYGPKKYEQEATSAFSEVDLGTALNQVTLFVTTANLLAKSILKQGPSFFNAQTAAQFCNNVDRAVGYMYAFGDVFGWDTVEKSLKDKWASINNMADEVLAAAKTASAWDMKAANAYKALEWQKLQALQRGDLADPAFTDSERAYYKVKAKADQLNYANMGMEISESAQNKMKRFAKSPDTGGMGLVLGAIGIAAAVYFTMR